MAFQQNGTNSSKQKELSQEQKCGVITLTPKKEKDLRYMKNWRPISLLNIDYKILTKILANRLQKVIGKLVNNNQVGYIKGRYIGENVREIADLLAYTSLHQVPGRIALIDYEKAFNTVNQFLINFLLKHYNPLILVRYFRAGSKYYLQILRHVYTIMAIPQDIFN